MPGKAAAGHEEVAGAFRCALDQHRRLDLDEGTVAQVVAHVPDNLVAKDDVLLHRRTAEIEVAISSRNAFVDVDSSLI